MKYRRHRGSLEESMKTIVEVNSKEELLLIIQEDWKDYEIIRDVIIDERCIYDERTGWNTHYVIAKIWASEFVCGMSDGTF